MPKDDAGLPGDLRLKGKMFFRRVHFDLLSDESVSSDELGERELPAEIRFVDVDDAVDRMASNDRYIVPEADCGLSFVMRKARPGAGEHGLFDGLG